MNPETLKALQQIQALVQQILEMEGANKPTQPEQMPDHQLDAGIDRASMAGMQ